MKKISIIVPIYNEEKTLLEILEKIEKSSTLGLEKELILIDDYSSDGTKEILKNLENKYKVIYHQKNLGKAAALRAGFKEAKGELILIQDADLEYDPKDYPQLLKPLLENKADVVYGTRYQEKNTSVYKSHYWGVKLISWLTNLLYGSKLSDVYCCYKVFKTSALDNLKLESNDFDIEQELTVKFLNKGYNILEVPVSYYPRKFEEGKKIRWSSGVKAVWIMIKYKFVS